MVANLKKDASIVILDNQVSGQFQNSKALEQVPEGFLVDFAPLTVCMLDKLLFALWPEGQCIRSLSYCVRILSRSRKVKKTRGVWQCEQL